MTRFLASRHPTRVSKRLGWVAALGAVITVVTFAGSLDAADNLELSPGLSFTNDSPPMNDRSTTTDV